MEQWREMRAAYDEYLYAAFEAAEEACSGRLLNERGEKAHIEPLSLFYGTRARAYAYASEELVAWWSDHPRTTVTQFEAGWPYPEEE